MLKPPGMTSHDVVAFVRRLSNKAKVGHLGTLDPAAAGVLPVAVGAATKTISYCASVRKCYVAEVLFGLETDTLDLEGTVIRRDAVVELSLEKLQQACLPFHGTVMQEPPKVCALHIDGRRSYDLVRSGRDFAMPSRPAVYNQVTVLEVDGDRAKLVVDCGPGTYIRALARDLGTALGLGATLAFLLRTDSGIFNISSAVTMQELAACGLETNLVSVEEVLQRCGYGSVQVRASIIQNGSTYAVISADSEALPGSLVRFSDQLGRFRGLGRLSDDGRHLHSEKMLDVS